MKTLNEKLAMLAEWMGCKRQTIFAGWEPVVRYGFKDTHITEMWHFLDFENNVFYHTSFDALWPPLRKFFNLKLDGDNAVIHDGFKVKISLLLLSSDTPAPAFELLVEGVEWLNSLNTEK